MVDERDISERRACAYDAFVFYFIGVSSSVFLCCAIAGALAVRYPSDERVISASPASRSRSRSSSLPSVSTCGRWSIP